MKDQGHILKGGRKVKVTVIVIKKLEERVKVIYKKVDGGKVKVIL